MNPVARFVRKPIPMSAAAVILVIVVACAAAEFTAPFGPLVQDLAAANELPSAVHPLGTDVLGRDLLSRLLHGGQVSLLGAFIAVSVFTVLGVPLGLIAGYMRGAVDAVLNRIVEVLFAVPVVVILLVVLAVYSSNLTAAMVTLGILGFGSLFRVVRGSTFALTGELYVKAAKASGLTHVAIIRRHILPNVWGPVVVQVSLFAASAVLVESGLAFLGFSVKPPDPSWGSMVGDASKVISSYPWQLFPAGATIALVVLGFGLIGDGVRDALVPGSGLILRGKARGGGTPVRDIPRHNDQALLSVRDLSVAYSVAGAESVVIRNVNFDVMPGEALGIVGESGSGKTVTARSLLGLLGANGRAISGTICFDGVNLGKPAPSTLSKLRGGKIGLIPQEPMNTLDPVFTIGSQIIEVVRRHDRGSKSKARERMIELLELVKMPDPLSVARKYPHELSGGMAQRVGIALALAGRPKLLVADEPTTALDVTVQEQILDLLIELQHRLGMSIVLVTHDWGVLAEVCDRAIVMYAGEVVEQAIVEELFVKPLHPYTRALIAANPHTAQPGVPLPSIHGQVPPPALWPRGCHFANRCPIAIDACHLLPIEMVHLDPDRDSRCIRVDEMQVTT